MVKDMLQEMLDYHYWATARILDKAHHLSPRQLAQPVMDSHKSLRNILFHIVRVEHIWRNLSEHGSVTPIQNHELILLPDIFRRWQEEEQALRAHVDRLTAEDLAAEVTLTDANGHAVQETRWHMLMQLLTHSAQHRAEAALLLTRFGQSPGDLDFIFFLDEKPQ